MEVVECAKKIKEKGGRLYLVGGAVRDKLLGLEPHDRDYCVTGLSQDEFENMFDNIYLRGKKFAVYDINGEEFALARRDKKVGMKHNDFEVDIQKEITIQEDLSRRDVTINSIAIDVLTGQIIDPFNGRKDIENKVIRATSEAFGEDPLRVYRVAVLATRYNFEIEDKTIELMKSLNKDLKYISGERVLEELKKALRCNKPSIFFQVLKKAECLQEHFKEIYDLIGVEQPVKYHPEGDAFNHTMEVIDRAAMVTSDVKIRFCALVHDLGKALTPQSNWPHHYNHEKLGVKPITSLCKRLHISNEWRKSAITSCTEHMLGGKYYQLKNSTKVDLFERVYKSQLGLEGLEIIVNADKHPQNRIQFAKIGEYIMKNINGKEMTGIKDYKALREKIRQKRIAYLIKEYT